MGRTANGQPVPPGRISAFAVDVGQHPTVPILGAIIYGFGSLAIFFAIAYLFRATRARRPGMPQIALILAAVGSVGFGVGRAVSEVARYLGARSFVDAVDKTNSAASDALSPTATLVGQLIWETSALALGFGIAIISLNAMRVGLLTRFMGVLGVIVGVAVAPILPIDQQGDHPRLLAGRARDALPGPAAQRHAQGVGDRRSRAVADPAAAARAARGGGPTPAQRRAEDAERERARGAAARPRRPGAQPAPPDPPPRQRAQRVEEEAQAALLSG